MRKKKIGLLLAGIGLIAALAAGCGNAPAGTDTEDSKTEENGQKEEKPEQDAAGAAQDE